jgi:hypothetical protein
MLRVMSKRQKMTIIGTYRRDDLSHLENCLSFFSATNSATIVSKRSRMQRCPFGRRDATKKSPDRLLDVCSVEALQQSLLRQEARLVISTGGRNLSPILRWVSAGLGPSLGRTLRLWASHRFPDTQNFKDLSLGLTLAGC